MNQAVDPPSRHQTTRILASAEIPVLVKRMTDQGNPGGIFPAESGLPGPVDSLGLTLDALATGVPSFDETDPLGLNHAHLACDPLPQQERVPWLPDPPARLILTELVRLGNQSLFAFCFFSLLDTCHQLADLDAEVAVALSVARRMGNRHGEQIFLLYRQLIRALEGRTAGPGCLTDADFDESAFLEAVQHNPTAGCYFYIHRALSALLFDDESAAARHAESATALTHDIHGQYPTALANLLHTLTLTQRLRALPASEHEPLLERLAINHSWLAARAADAPTNFAHLYDLVEAERLDVLGQPWQALQTIEQAMRRAQAHQRPWHYALITERAGWLHMRHGLEHAGRTLLTRAYHLYRQWGATGKSQAMRRALPFVAITHPGDASRSHADALDQTTLLRASVALAVETSQTGLVARVMELVAQMTGATDARFLTQDEAGHWYLEGGIQGGDVLGRMSLAEAERQRLLPTSVLRLGLKTQMPVVSDDAVLDSRFAADSHFAGLPFCSLLGLPVVVQGQVRAFFILENRRLRAAFDAQRVIDLIGGIADGAPLLQSLRLASLGGLVALHSVLDARNQDLRDAQQQALNRARLALEEVARERAIRDQQDQFIDLVAHEYRTPLAIMQTNLEILMLTQDPARWRDGLHNMGLAIQRLGEIFDGSLRCGDWDGHRPMRLEPIDLPAWLGERIDETRAGWPVSAPAIRLQTQGPAVIQADPALLKTVLLNLLDNARKYGLLTGIIAVDLAAADGQVILSVGNDCPLDPEQETADLLAKRVRGVNSQGIPGLGMGLYLVNRLVSDQGGRIELRRDQPGRFEIRLMFPVRQETTA